MFYANLSSAPALCDLAAHWSPAFPMLSYHCKIMQTCTSCTKILHQSINKLPVVITRQDLLPHEAKTKILPIYISSPPRKPWPCILYIKSSSNGHTELLNATAVTIGVWNELNASRVPALTGVLTEQLAWKYVSRGGNAHLNCSVRKGQIKL